VAPLCNGPTTKRCPLFNFNGLPFTKDRLQKALKASLQYASVPTQGLTLHSFRKGAAQHAKDIGIRDEQIQAMGGWTSSSVKRQIREATDEALQRLYWTCRRKEGFLGDIPNESMDEVTTDAIQRGLGLINNSGLPRLPLNNLKQSTTELNRTPPRGQTTTTPAEVGLCLEDGLLSDSYSFSVHHFRGVATIS
jgi:hypothetical protein